MSDIMKNGVFDWDVFKDTRNKIVVHLKTQEECDEFSKMLDEHGMKWCSNKTYLENNLWNQLKENTCYSNRGEYADFYYYKERNIPILEFSDYFKKETKQKGEPNMNNITVNMENLTAEEREQLLALVKKANKPKVWKPKKYEEYYYINTNGDISRDVWDKYNVYGEGRYSIGNCFCAEEEAKFAIERLKVITELKRFAQEYNNKEINWKDFEQQKYYIYYSNYEQTIRIDCFYKTQCNGIYFTSRKVAKDAIKAIGEERLKKYYFEIKD